MKTHTRPSPYSPTPFHITNIALFLSSTIVTSILIYFCAQLQHDDFKLPWTFIVMLAGSILTLISLTLTTSVYYCAFLSPLFRLIINVPLLILWMVGLGLFSYNMFGALGRSCSIANWGNSDGVTVCEGYKAMFSFVILGLIFAGFGLFVDIKARQTQNSMGKYGTVAGPEDKQSLVGHDRNESMNNEVPYGVLDHEYRDRPSSHSQPSFGSSNQSIDRFSPEYTSGHGDIAMSDFRYRAAPQPQHVGDGSYGGYQAFR